MDELKERLEVAEGICGLIQVSQEIAEYKGQKITKIENIKRQQRDISDKMRNCNMWLK